MKIETLVGILTLVIAIITNWSEIKNVINKIKNHNQTIPSTQKKITKLNFVLNWILATIIGWTLSHFISDLFSVSDALGGLLGGAIVGILQGIILKNYFKEWWIWIPATALGWAFGWTQSGMLENGLSFPSDTIMLAIFQCIVLYKFFKLAWYEVLLWFFITIIVWTLGWHIAIEIIGEDDILGKILGGLFDGTITGICMMLFLKKHFTKTNSSQQVN